MDIGGVGCMRKWLPVIAVFGLSLLITSAAAASGRPGARWWDTPEVVEALKLSDAEIQRLDQGYEASSLRMIELKSHVEAERFKLESALEQETFDEAAVEAQYNRLEAARSALGKERFAFLVKVREIIGPRRFHELMQIYQERRMKRKSSH